MIEEKEEIEESDDEDEKQKKGKAKMMAHGKGSVDIPASAYLAVLKR